MKTVKSTSNVRTDANGEPVVIKSVDEYDDSSEEKDIKTEDHKVNKELDKFSEEEGSSHSYEYDYGYDNEEEDEGERRHYEDVEGNDYMDFGAQKKSNWNRIDSTEIAWYSFKDHQKESKVHVRHQAVQSPV